MQQEGPGWRLARDPDRGLHPVLIGGAGWAFELTEAEWAALGLGRQIVLRVPGSLQRSYPMHVPFHSDQLA